MSDSLLRRLADRVLVSKSLWTAESKGADLKRVDPTSTQPRSYSKLQEITVN